MKFKRMQSHSRTPRLTLPSVGYTQVRCEHCQTKTPQFAHERHERDPRLQLFRITKIKVPYSSRNDMSADCLSPVLKDWYAVAACIFEESGAFSRVLAYGFTATKGSSQIHAVTVS